VTSRANPYLWSRQQGRGCHLLADSLIDLDEGRHDRQRQHRQGADRAFISDQLPKNQLARGFLIQSMFVGLAVGQRPLRAPGRELVCRG
jgi:hypothetical protein